MISSRNQSFFSKEDKITDENWECTPQETEAIDSENVNVNQNLDDNVEYIKWFRISQVQQPTKKPDTYEYDVFNERYGKSKTVIVGKNNENDEDNYEASGFGGVEVQDKNNVINTQILHLNQLMKDAKRKSSGASILAGNSGTKMKGMTGVTSEAPSVKPVISEDILKALLEYSKELIHKPTEKPVRTTPPPPRQTVLQPIVRPIYINVPVQHHQVKQDYQYNPYNPSPYSPAFNQDSYFSNVSQLPLMDSYGYPIVSHLKNPYYPYQQNPYQYFERPVRPMIQSPYQQSPYQLSPPSYNDFEKYDPPMYDDTSVEMSSEEMAGTKRFAYLGGTIFPYDQYKHSILPYLKRTEVSENVEVLTCSSSSRQPNKTDCTKYFVCNPQTGVHPYSCPLTTAFNEKTKLCDIKTYKECKRNKNRQENMYLKQQKDSAKLHYEMLKAIEELKQLRRQASQYARRPPPQPRPPSHPIFTPPSYSEEDQYMEEPEPTPPPPPPPPPIASRKKNKPRKRLTCLQPGKVPDPDSQDHYYVCFKTPENILKLHKMKCPQRFVFCKSNNLCVLPGTCG